MICFFVSNHSRLQNDIYIMFTMLQVPRAFNILFIISSCCLICNLSFFLLYFKIMYSSQIVHITIYFFSFLKDTASFYFFFLFSAILCRYSSSVFYLYELFITNYFRSTEASQDFLWIIFCFPIDLTTPPCP